MHQRLKVGMYVFTLDVRHLLRRRPQVILQLHRPFFSELRYGPASQFSVGRFPVLALYHVAVFPLLFMVAFLSVQVKGILNALAGRVKHCRQFLLV